MPAPGGALPLLAPQISTARVAASPLGMAAGEEQSVQKLRFGEGADEEMGGAMLVEGVQGFRIFAGEQDQQGRRIGFGRIADRAHRRQTLVQRAARIDHGHGGTGGEKARFRLVPPPRRDRLPARTLDKPGQLVAVTKRENEKRRPHGAGLTCLNVPANRRASGHPALVH